MGQTATTRAELAPYVKRVHARIEKNRESIVWEQLDDRWLALVEEYRGLLAAWQRGRPGSRYERAAAAIVVKLAEQVPAREVVVAALGMYLLKQDQPHRFVSELAFRTQLVRRIQSLGQSHVAQRYDHASGKQRLIYRENSPKGVAIVGHRLATTIGAAGLRLAQLEDEDRTRRRQESEAVRVALAELS